MPITICVHQGVQPAFHDIAPSATLEASRLRGLGHFRRVVVMYVFLLFPLLCPPCPPLVCTCVLLPTSTLSSFFQTNTFCEHLLTSLVGGGRPPSWTTGGTFFPMRFKEEQVMRGNCQTVNLMHISNPITSYGIFMEEVDCVEGEEDGRWGEVSTRVAGGE